MTSPLKAYLGRSLDVLKRNTSKVLAANPTPDRRGGHLIYSMSKAQNPNLNINDFATGCDSDIGGQSTCTLDLDENGDGRFWGEMKLGVKKEFEGKVRGGYAGFRNKNLSSIFGVTHHDLSPYTHLAITLRPSGEASTLRHWFVNIQTDGPVRSDLFQQRLPLSPSKLAEGKGYNQWQTVHIPLDGFVLTNSGMLSDTQIGMMTEKVRTVGFSILGGGREAISAPKANPESQKEDLLRNEPDFAEDEFVSPEALEEKERRIEAAAALSHQSSAGIEGLFELGIQEVRAVDLDSKSVPEEEEEW